jgi:hypothetical protein
MGTLSTSEILHCLSDKNTGKSCELCTGKYRFDLLDLDVQMPFWSFEMTINRSFWVDKHVSMTWRVGKIQAIDTCLLLLVGDLN